MNKEYFIRVNSSNMEEQLDKLTRYVPCPGAGGWGGFDSLDKDSRKSFLRNNMCFMILDGDNFIYWNKEVSDFKGLYDCIMIDDNPLEYGEL